MFHVEEQNDSESDSQINDLSLRAHKIYIEFQEIIKDLEIKDNLGLIEILTKGYRIKKEKYTTRDWSHFIQKVESDSVPIIDEFKKIILEKSTLLKNLDDNQTQKEAFGMLENFSIDLNRIKSLRRFYLVFSLIPTKDIKEVKDSLPEEIILSTSLTNTQSALLIAAPKKEMERVDKILRTFEIRQFEIPDKLPQNPIEALDAVKKEIEHDILRLGELEKKIDNTLAESSQKILSLREGSKTAYDVLSRTKRTGNLNRFATIIGYVPARNLNTFSKDFGHYITFIEDIETHGYKKSEAGASSPTLMKNLPFIRAFENITLNQGPPRRGEVDPTPFITLTFPIFYGIMFGDFGHGLILALFGLLLFFRGYGSIKQWGIMLTVAGIFAAIIGILIGEVFGFALGSLIPGLEHPVLEIVERAHGITGFNTEAVTTILQISIIIGIIHLTIGFGLDVFKAFKEKDYVEGLTEKLPTFFMYIFGIMFALAFIGAGNSFSGLLTKENAIPLLGLPVSQATLISLPIIFISIIVLIIGKPVAIIAGKIPKDSIAMSLVMGVVEFLIRIVEFLANTMSYARLGILLLVHAALLMVLNRAIALPLAISIPMLIIFNILIMLLEGLIVYIQDLRLHLYEWFTKFYDGTGTIFKSIKPETIYLDIDWEK
jgi:V/A-type H+-transporting ATPase subunit I